MDLLFFLSAANDSSAPKPTPLSFHLRCWISLVFFLARSAIQLEIMCKVELREDTLISTRSMYTRYQFTVFSRLCVKLQLGVFDNISVKTRLKYLFTFACVIFFKSVNY